jgi:hypothetical protein
MHLCLTSAISRTNSSAVVSSVEMGESEDPDELDEMRDTIRHHPIEFKRQAALL